MSFLPIQTESQVSLNWHKVIEVGESLFISPLIGFGLAFGIMSISYIYFSKKQRIFEKPEKKEVPELWLRSLLIAASSWVSFAHGSNDGQKGVGLVMLILISLIPGSFALNPETDREGMKSDISYIQNALTETTESSDEIMRIETHIATLAKVLEDDTSSSNDIRTAILFLQKEFKNLETVSLVSQAQASDISTLIESKDFQEHSQNLYDTIDYAPWWVIAMISVSLGIGTMFGWRRIVKTLGKKIGNHKMSYAESTTSALITAMTITFASRVGLPVSTTHIFSSSIAGCMMTGKKPGLQQDTIKHILMAWLLTLPITIIVSGLLFSGFWAIFL